MSTWPSTTNCRCANTWDAIQREWIGLACCPNPAKIKRCGPCQSGRGMTADNKASSLGWGWRICGSTASTQNSGPSIGITIPNKPLARVTLENPWSRHLHKHPVTCDPIEWRRVGHLPCNDTIIDCRSGLNFWNLSNSTPLIRSCSTSDSVIRERARQHLLDHGRKRLDRNWFQQDLTNGRCTHHDPPSFSTTRPSILQTEGNITHVVPALGAERLQLLLNVTIAWCFNNALEHYQRCP